MSQPAELVRWRSTTITSATVRINNTEKVIVKFGELEYDASKDVLIQQSEAMNYWLTVRDPAAGELNINQAFVLFPDAVKIFLDFMHFGEAVDLGLSSCNDDLAAYKMMVFYMCHESLIKLFHKALMKRLSSSWGRQSPEWAAEARDICRTRAFRCGNTKLWNLFRSLIVRSTVMELAAIVLQDLGNGEAICSHPITMDCMAKAGHFSYNHTDGDVDFRFLIDASQGAKIEICVTRSPLGAVYNFHLLPSMEGGDRRYDARGEVRSTGQWSMARSPVPIAVNPNFHLIISYTKEWSILNVVRLWLQANGHLLEDYWFVHAADPTAVDVDLITIFLSFNSLVECQPEGRQAGLLIARSLGRCLDPYSPNDIKSGSLQRLEKDYMAEFLKSLYTENSPKPGFQPTVLVQLLKVWGDFELETRKRQVLEIKQELAFLNQVSNKGFAGELDPSLHTAASLI